MRRIAFVLTQVGARELRAGLGGLFVGLVQTVVGKNYHLSLGSFFEEQL